MGFFKAKTKIAYSYWGFLGDIKYSEDFKVVSTPDGNAFYSWSILSRLIDDGNEVLCVMPDRDEPGFRMHGTTLFSAWCKSPRSTAYLGARHIEYLDMFDIKNRKKLTYEKLAKLWDFYGLNKFSAVIHEWRMTIPGRNTEDCMFEETWQPDLFIQTALIKYCNINNVKLIIFDLDYKIDDMTARGMIFNTKNTYILELGKKWKSLAYETDGRCRKVYIPFDFNYIDTFKPETNFKDKIVYVGNRYERDWCIDKYLKNVTGLKVFGNWLESGRDSSKRWPDIKFGNRLQTCDMHGVYSNAATTILLAKEDYCKYEFMTARILEAVFYGCVPLFIEEYGDSTIEKYAGSYSDMLKVRSSKDVELASSTLSKDVVFRNKIIKYLRTHLRFMDVTNFVSTVYGIILL